MRKILVLVLAALTALLPLQARAENPAPEILSAEWSDGQGGILVTFRKNGAEGEYALRSRHGGVTDPWHGAIGLIGVEAADEVNEYLCRNANLVPGETYSFQIIVTAPDGQETASEEKEAAVPITDGPSPIGVFECSVPDLSREKLVAMREALIGYILDWDPYTFTERFEEIWPETVSASFRTTDITKVLVTTPHGDVMIFDAGKSPLSGDDNYYDFARRLAEEFVGTWPIDAGRYEVRVYDRERLCLLGMYHFNVTE